MVLCLFGSRVLRPVVLRIDPDTGSRMAQRNSQDTGHCVSRWCSPRHHLAGTDIVSAKMVSVILKFLIAGGGTGGHVIPALAIARELQARYSAEVLFVGTARGIENRPGPQAGYPLELVNVGALQNVSLATRLRTL